MYGYAINGFPTLQLAMDKFIISQYYTDPTVGEPTVMASLSFMPVSKFSSSDFQYVIASVLGIFYMLAFLYPVSQIVRGLVIEKETRVKEGMKMMGLTDLVYNLSWLITLLVQMTLIAFLITLVTWSSVFEYSNKIYVFVYFFMFGKFDDSRTKYISMLYIYLYYYSYIIITIITIITILIIIRSYHYVSVLSNGYIFLEVQDSFVSRTIYFLRYVHTVFFY